ncbi:hypothetical protein HK100_000077, partial [Physocladia obscura]
MTNTVAVVAAAGGVLCAFWWFLPAAWGPKTARALASLGEPQPENHSHRLFFARTFHTRFKPAHHSFAFNVFYAGISVGGRALDKDSFFFAKNKWAVLSIWDKDYLPNSSDFDETSVLSIREKVLREIDRVKSSASSLSIGRIELVTAPRFFGFRSFNPLSVYYCFDDSENPSLQVIILEVSNTFGERHVYVLDEHNKWPKPKEGFASSYTIDRNFFVSPFNNRSGIYEAHIASMDDNKMGVLLVLKDYIANLGEISSKPDQFTGENFAKKNSTSAESRNEKNATTENTFSKHLMASVSGTSVPMTPATILCVLLFHPFTVFLTLPRIMSEAWKLAYIKKLPIYAKPNPTRDGSAGPVPGTSVLKGKGSTFLHLSWSDFDEFSKNVVFDYFVRRCILKKATLLLSFPDSSQVYISNQGVQKNPANDVNPMGFIEKRATAHIYLLSPALFTRLVLDFNNPGRALCSTFLSGDWSATKKQDIIGFLSLFSTEYSLEAEIMTPSQENEENSDKIQKVCTVNEWYHGDTLTEFPPFATNIKLSRVTVFENNTILDGADTLDARAARVVSGTRETWAIEYAFRAVTKFVVDPYAVALRVKSDYSINSDGCEKNSGIFEVPEGWKLLGEFDDSFDWISREKTR